VRPNFVHGVVAGTSGLAAFAGAKSSTHGLLNGREEPNVIAKGPPALALRPAEDAGRYYGIEESACAVAITQLLPCLLCIDLPGVLGDWLYGCELNVVRHDYIVSNLRFPYTPILAPNSGK